MSVWVEFRVEVCIELYFAFRKDYALFEVYDSRKKICVNQYINTLYFNYKYTVVTA